MRLLYNKFTYTTLPLLLTSSVNVLYRLHKKLVRSFFVRSEGKVKKQQQQQRLTTKLIGREAGYGEYHGNWIAGYGNIMLDMGILWKRFGRLLGVVVVFSCLFPGNITEGYTGISLSVPPTI